MTKIRLFILFVTALTFSACSDSGNAPEDGQDSAQTPDQSVAIDISAIESVEIVPGLSRKILRDGSGAVAEDGHTAVVHYTGWLYNTTAANNRGSKFDSSVDRDTHFEFPLGAGRVIEGWDQGVVGMKIGEIRELTIAPELAYRDREDIAVIPPGSTLIFEVELADLKGLGQEESDTP